MLFNKLFIVTVFEVPEFPQNKTGLPTSTFHFSMKVFRTVSIVGTRIELNDNPGGVTNAEIWDSQGSNVNFLKSKQYANKVGFDVGSDLIGAGSVAESIRPDTDLSTLSNIT